MTWRTNRFDTNSLASRVRRNSSLPPHFRGRPWRRLWQWPDQKDLYEARIIDLFRVSTLDEALRSVVRGSWYRTRLFVAWSETPRFGRCRYVLNASRFPPCFCSSYCDMPVLSDAHARCTPEACKKTKQMCRQLCFHGRRAQHSPRGVVSGVTLLLVSLRFVICRCEW